MGQNDDMISFVLIDDHYLVIEEFCSILDWEAYGFRLMGTAKNGKHGYELCKKVMPDVVITDIEMPVMSGLELAERIRDELLETKIILLTCHDQFDYALQAIKLKADDYIVKGSSNYDEIQKILMRQKEIIIRERTKKQEKQRLEKEIRQMKYSVKQLFLRDLLAGIIKDESKIKDGLVNSNLLTTNSLFTVCIYYSNFEKYNRTDHSHNENLSEVLKTITNIYKSHWKHFEVCPFYDTKGWVVITSHPTNMQDGQLIRINQTVSSQVIQMIKRKYNITVTAGISNSRSNLCHIDKMIQESMCAIDWSFYEGSNRTYFYDLRPFKENIPPEAEEFLNRLLSAPDIDLNYLEEAASYTMSLIRKNAPQPHCVISFFRRIFKHLQEMTPVASLSPVNWEKVTAGDTSMKTLEELLYLWIQEYRDNRLSVSLSQKKPVEWVKHWVIDHLNEAPNLDDLADRLHMSPKYLSNLFRKETGDSFLSFLNRIRLERAKYLLVHTNFKIVNIAAEVGLNDSNYFSRFFKKHAGVSPNEYRERSLDKYVAH